MANSPRLSITFAALMLVLGAANLPNTQAFAAGATGNSTMAHAQQFGSWTYRCSPPAALDNSQSKSCEIVQTIRDPNGVLIAQAAFGKTDPASSLLIAVFQVPDGALLTEPIRFGAEASSSPISAQYLTCFDGGCYARGNTNHADVIALAGASNGAMQFVQRNGRAVRVQLNFDGFEAALTKLSGKS